MPAPTPVDELQVSFAQHGEDVVLGRIFDQPSGFWIDVGANEPVVDSVTHAFSLRGWSGINLEPQRALHQKLVGARPRDVNLQVAVSDRAGVLEFHEVEEAHGHSTANAQLVAHYRSAGRKMTTRTVPCVTLREICEQHVGSKTIDFLKIDVEGLECEVIRGGDFARFRPRVLLLEAGVRTEEWHPLVLSLGYLDALDDGLNRFYVRSEDAPLREKLKHPANVNDRYVKADLAELIRGGKEWDSLGPVIQGIARRLAAVKDSNPALKAHLKRLLGL